MLLESSEAQCSNAGLTWLISSKHCPLDSICLSRQCAIWWTVVPRLCKIDARSLPKTWKVIPTRLQENTEHLSWQNANQKSHFIISFENSQCMVCVQSALVCNIFLIIIYFKYLKCQKQFCKSSRAMSLRKGLKVHADILHFFWLAKILWGPRTSHHNKIIPTTQRTVLCRYMDKAGGKQNCILGIGHMQLSKTYLIQLVLVISMVLSLQ